MIMTVEELRTRDLSRCSYPHCRKNTDVIYKNKSLCDKHYEMITDKEDVEMEKLLKVTHVKLEK